MLNFKLWLEEQIPHGAIKVPLPSVEMQREGACGAQAFRAICLYFGVGPQDEKEHMKLLGTNERDGTWPESIVKHAKDLGFQVKSKIKMEVAELVNFLDRGIPVICAMQAWSKPEKYNNNSSGHYVVAVGYDKNNIYFEDSVLKDKRGVLPIKEFVSRWHDVDAHGHKCERLGIALWMARPKKIKKLTKAEKIN